MPEYKFIYLPLRARGEISRLLFAVGGVAYEDCRVKDADWPSLKKTTPYGQLPILEVEGEVICQSRAIEIFLARRFGLCGKNDIQEAKVIMIRECCADLWDKCTSIYLEKDETKKGELKKAFEEGTLITYMTNLQKFLNQNKGGDGYFVGDSITYADLTFQHYLDLVKPLAKVDVPWDKWPKLKALNERVKSHPKVADWIAKRPVTNL
ncbi:hypothetical protein LSH36_352g02010 [Paralvinella palmiformis]|uniref:Glutathione S-transferase n=1 Tax=Paralvinella palmiformis TaxID=53620 RepID=A0AAD9JEN1_9ANNE|nr:hypothetical protein LSH36_352g02010 [Paralvinella palmiformis]